MEKKSEHNGIGLNFLNKKKTRRRRKAKIIWASVGVVLALLVIGIFAFRKPAFALYSHAISGKSYFLSAQAAITDQKFLEAKDDLEKATAEFEEAKSASKKLRLLKIIPGIARQIGAVDNLLQVGIQAGKAATTLANVADRVTKPLQQDGEVTLANISAKEKRGILELVSQSEPDIQGAKADLDLAMLYLEDIPKHGLVPPLGSAIEPIREQLPKIQQSIEQALPAIRVVPSFVGYPAERTYLFLLQNNNELRPTGGFIGTYGILKLKDGEVTSLNTDNIYNLDVKAESFTTLEPPKPLTKYLQSEQWYMRDGNWSPDFPTAAQQVLTMYDLETRSKHSFDGVMAITPTFIQELMSLTGSITVDGVTFTQENIIDQLQYQVEVAFIQKGISDAERKDIIGDLSQTLFDRLLTLPRTKWGDLSKSLQKSVLEKHFILYLNDSEAQDLVLDQGWGGNVLTNEGDSVLVIDANMASLKTDQAVERSIDYQVSQDGDQLFATLRITYKNTGTFDWKTTRYRTYTRVYVPSGSELLSSSGYLENDKLHGGKDGTVETSDDLGKTVFGGFTSIEPKEERTLELRYRLPAAVRDAYHDGRYSLLFQKQAGTIGHGLHLDVKTPGRIQSYSLDGTPRVEGNAIQYQTDLRQDRTFTVVFRP